MGRVSGSSTCSLSLCKVHDDDDDNDDDDYGLKANYLFTT